MSSHAPVLAGNLNENYIKGSRAYDPSARTIRWSPEENATLRGNIGDNRATPVLSELETEEGCVGGHTERREGSGNGQAHARAPPARARRALVRGLGRRTSLPVHLAKRARVGGDTRSPLPQALLAAFPRRLAGLADLRDAPAGKGNLPGDA